MIRAVVSGTLPIGLKSLGLSVTQTLREACEVLDQLSCQANWQLAAVWGYKKSVDGGYMSMYIA